MKASQKNMKKNFDYLVRNGFFNEVEGVFLGLKHLPFKITKIMLFNGDKFVLEYDCSDTNLMYGDTLMLDIHPKVGD